MASHDRKYSRRTVALFWCAVVGIVAGTLIYMEQIPILYVLATLSLVVLLTIVAFAHLERVGRETMDGSGPSE